MRGSLWFIFLLCSTVQLSPFIAAQPSSATKSEDDSVDNATMAILVLIVVSAILFLGSFSLWIQNCCVDSGNSYYRSAMSLGSRSRFRQRGDDRDPLSLGVDKAVIDSFPSIVYSAAKAKNNGAGSVECAVCLGEFSGGETLRVIPKCGHVFHLHCIARWLANHTTCPVCRAGVIDSCRNPIELERNVSIRIIDQEEGGGNNNSVSVEEEMVKSKQKLKRSASCESGSGEGSGSQLGRWLGRSERWGSSVEPSEWMAVKGDESTTLPV